MTPGTYKNDLTGQTLPFPCGKCPACYSRRVSQWSLRLMKEEETSQTAYFVTLTYDTKYVPITPNGFMSLSRNDRPVVKIRPSKKPATYTSDLQLYFKRLRKLNENKIKYFAVGEYGGHTRRPHYHIILFNATEKSITQAWRQAEHAIGHVHIGSLTGASVGYTLKYLSKHSDVSFYNDADDRIPEFALMSKGLGAGYITASMIRWHYADLQNRMFCNLQDGKKVSMPRYYKQKIYSPEQRQAVAAQARKNQLLEYDRIIQDNPYYERDHAESVKQQFLNMAKKKLEGQKL